MKKQIIALLIISILFLNMPFITNGKERVESIEQISTKVTFHMYSPLNSKIISKNIPLDVANNLFQKCKSYNHTANEQKELIRTLLTNVFKEQGITQKELSDILKHTIPSDSSIITKEPSQATTSLLFASINSAGSGRITPFLLLPRPRIFLSWKGDDYSLTTAASLQTDKGFTAAGNQKGLAIGFIGIGLTYATPQTGRLYGLIGYCLYTNVLADLIEGYPPNHEPIISNPNPENFEQNVNLNLSELSFHISDIDYDRMNYEVTTNPDIGKGSGSFKKDGTYSIPISNLERNTEYSWTVSVNDGQDSTSSTYSFTTEIENPVVLNPNPADYSSTSSSITSLKCELYDAQNDLMDYTIETNPHIGRASAIQVSNGIITIPVYGLQKDTWYHWYVNVTDRTYETKEQYSFFTGSLGLIGYWPFDDGSGTTLTDASNKNDGIIHGATWASGIKDSCLDFEGINDYVKFNNKLIPKGEKTITAWINPRVDSHSWTSHTIIGNGNMNKKYDGFDFYYRHHRHDIYAWAHQDGDYIFKINSTDGSIIENEWNFVVFTWDGTTNNNGVKLYVNGKLDISNTAFESNEKLGDFDAIIGCRTKLNDPNDMYWFNGKIDEIRIFNRALSDIEIKDIYENP